MPILRIGILPATKMSGPVAHVEISISEDQTRQIIDELVKAGHGEEIENFCVQSRESFISIMTDDGSEFWK